MCVEQDLAKVTEEPYIRSKVLYANPNETYIRTKGTYIRNSPQGICRKGSRKGDRRALYTLKRAVRIPKRALHTYQRTQQSFIHAPWKNPVHDSKQPCTYSKEHYIRIKEAKIQSNEPCPVLERILVDVCRAGV